MFGKYHIFTQNNWICRKCQKIRMNILIKTNHKINKFEMIKSPWMDNFHVNMITSNLHYEQISESCWKHTFWQNKINSVNRNTISMLDALFIFFLKRGSTTFAHKYRNSNYINDLIFSWFMSENRQKKQICFQDWETLIY